MRSFELFPECVHNACIGDDGDNVYPACEGLLRKFSKVVTYGTCSSLVKKTDRQIFHSVSSSANDGVSVIVEGNAAMPTN